jgi:hypothetical protein
MNDYTGKYQIEPEIGEVFKYENGIYETAEEAGGNRCGSCAIKGM